MGKSSSYTEKDIRVLSDIEHVRLRLPVYAGNTSIQTFTIPFFANDSINIQDYSFVPAVYKCVNEIIDNCIDELVQTNQPTKHIKIESHPMFGMYTISDNGRGVPISKHKTGKYTPEVVFGSLRSGRNFTNDKDVGVIGANGMGSSVVCFCSTEFHIDINRGGKRYRQTFTDGGKEVTKPSIRKGTNKTGTSITFQLDPDIFEDISLTDELMRNRALEIALTNPGITTEYNGERFKFKKGFDELIRRFSSEYFVFNYNGCEFYVIFDVHEGLEEQMFTWVNSSFLFDGGLCNTQFLNAFVDRVVTHTKKEAKKQKCEVTKNDVRQNLLVVGNLRLANPEYDSQAKTRLTGPNLRKELAAAIDNNWNSFTRRNKEWLQTVLDRAAERHHRQADKKAMKDHQKKIGKKIPGLIDATSKNRFDCQLIVTEGDSAAGMIADAREPETTASLPLRGKINNVYGSTVAQLLKMGKITDLLSAIGLVPGERAVRSNLRYGRVVIATDADHDGSDIMTLLVNLFYTYWPELFDPRYEPYFYRLIAPNVCAIKGNERIHFTTREQYEKKKGKYKSWKIKYLKGLGSMNKKDWDMILSGETDTLIPIQDEDGTMKETLNLLFSSDADARKEWLQSNE